MSLAATWGVLRSMGMYYGQPWKAGRMRRFYAQFIAPGDLCFDVGAHVGNRVRVFCALGARVVAVEPQPRMIQVLQRLYGGRDTVVIAPVGISDAPGALTLHINTRNPTLTSFSEEWVQGFSEHPDIPAAPWDDTVEVEVQTLDQLIAVHGVPAFCKVDVEGLEDRVLQGLSQPVPALSFEAYPLQKERSLAAIARVRALGAYRFRTVSAETFRWSQAEWVGGEEICRWIEQRSIADGSEDVYAQRVSD